jgi:hypothetical protein
MRAGDRRVHRDGPIYAPTRICDRQQPIQHPIPGPVRSQPVMPCPHRLPRPEHHRQIPPGDPRPIPIDDALDHRPRVRERPPLTSRPPRQQPLDQRPLGIREQLKSRHATRLTPPTTNICQTRPKSVDEVGSIHTVQGYDLNYAGVIIGPDLGYDAASGKLVFNRSSYFDSKGKENNPLIGRPYSDDDLLRFVVNIYSVLLTRGIRGTFIYVSDPSLRERLKRFIPISSTRDGT